MYSLLFNTSHGILIREKWDFPPNPFIPAWSLSKSLLCLLLHPGLKPFLFTWKQWWCHCYINRGLLCSVFQPGLWVNGMACLVIQTCFWKKSGMSPNTTWLVLKRKEYFMQAIFGYLITKARKRGWKIKPEKHILKISQTETIFYFCSTLRVHLKIANYTEMTFFVTIEIWTLKKINSFQQISRLSTKLRLNSGENG